MAATMLIPNVNISGSPNLSQVIASANDFIYGNRNHLYTVSNQQFHHSTPMNIQQGPPMFNMTHILPGPKFHYSIVETRVSGLEGEKDKLQYENIELKEKLLEMQAHLMIIFSGIKESSERQNEKVEDTIKEFIANELNINSETIQFLNVHRLKQRGDGKSRNIIAKFVKYSDHEMIRSESTEERRSPKCAFGVRQTLCCLLYNDHEAPYPPRSRQDAYAHGPQPGFVPGRERFFPRGPPPGHHAGPGFQSGST
ncbi:unnamed protein product [Mytilus coruscus]|uniref:Uncharacterized protein n=1 Tax=Mytilus coruscus TaxID=42192 RepID=A0A6J8B843_MYTCO|nr:unnamed protein product [Mytilus coruscus]